MEYDAILDHSLTPHVLRAFKDFVKVCAVRGEAPDLRQFGEFLLDETE